MPGTGEVLVVDFDQVEAMRGGAGTGALVVLARQDLGDRFVGQFPMPNFEQRSSDEPHHVAEKSICLKREDDHFAASGHIGSSQITRCAPLRGAYGSKCGEGVAASKSDEGGAHGVDI